MGQAGAGAARARRRRGAKPWLSRGWAGGRRDGVSDSLACVGSDGDAMRLPHWVCAWRKVALCTRRERQHGKLQGDR